MNDLPLFKTQHDILKQKIRQFLVHSFLYYQLSESVISDSEYDQLCVELGRMLQQSPEPVEFRDLVESALGAEASGFTIRQYPPGIVSAAIHLLYQTRYKNSTMRFPEFVERLGYQLNFPDS
ncbi:MAG: hypothetical protein HQM11_00510 [SAR324 cluster bacterium]|nr:hypothetical protein [SAR324 cluster bacterium]